MSRFSKTIVISLIVILIGIIYYFFMHQKKEVIIESPVKIDTQKTISDPNINNTQDLINGLKIKNNNL